MCYANQVTASNPLIVRRVIFFGQQLDWGEISGRFSQLEEWECALSEVACLGDVPLSPIVHCNCRVSPIASPMTSAIFPSTTASSDRVSVTSESAELAIATEPVSVVVTSPILDTIATTTEPLLPVTATDRILVNAVTQPVVVTTTMFSVEDDAVNPEISVSAGVLTKLTGSIKNIEVNGPSAHVAKTLDSSADVCTAAVVSQIYGWDCLVSVMGGVSVVVGLSVFWVIQILLSFHGLGHLLWCGFHWVHKVRIGSWFFFISTFFEEKRLL